jgi:hypothetical protein
MRYLLQTGVLDKNMERRLQLEGSSDSKDFIYKADRKTFAQIWPRESSIHVSEVFPNPNNKELGFCTRPHKTPGAHDLPWSCPLDPIMRCLEGYTLLRIGTNMEDRNHVMSQLIKHLGNLSDAYIVRGEYMTDMSRRIAA